MGRLAAAVTGMALIPAGLWSAVTPAASAASGVVSGVVTFSCKIATFQAYTWKPTVAISALRPEGTSTVTVTGKLTKMDGAAPVKLNYDLTTSLILDIGGTAVTATGASHVVTTAPSQPFPLPDTTGTFSSLGSDLAVKVNAFSFAMDPTGLNMKGVCTPTGGAALGALTPSDGVPPTPTVVPTTISSATAIPSASGSASATATNTAGTDAGTPAKGKATFACTLDPIGTKFDYPVTATVSGYRAKASDDVSLSATLTQMPGIAPVEIDGTMNITLGLTVDGKATTLSGSAHAKAGIKAPVPMPPVSGTVAAQGTDNLKVVVRSFTFAFPDLGFSAKCGASDVLSRALTLGKKAAPTASGSTGTTPTTTSSTTLPQTGATNLGLLLAWAAGLIAFGSSGLVLMRRGRRGTV